MGLLFSRALRTQRKTSAAFSAPTIGAQINGEDSTPAAASQKLKQRQKQRRQKQEQQENESKSKKGE